MFSEIAAGSDKVEAGVNKNDWMNDKVRAGGVFTVECFDKEGNLKWKESSHNLVVNVGLQDMNDKYFDGSTYTASWYLGLVTGPGSSNTYSANDTLGAHAGWNEFTGYTGNRKLVTWNGAQLADPSEMSNSSSPSSFVITGGAATVAGAFLASVSTGTGGILFSVSNFLSPGDRTVDTNDTLNVTYTFSLDAA